MIINALGMGMALPRGGPESRNIKWFAKNQPPNIAFESQGFLDLLATHIGGRP